MFQFFTTDEERLDALIDLGKSLDAPSTPFSEEDIVKGCASYVALRIKNGQIEGTSDAIIMKGFLKVLQIFYAETPQDDPVAFLKKLAIDSILSTQRQNGLLNILKKIQKDVS
ncbi:MAG: SufE family protein [Alphaproteobacteria bacterium]|nr:SufE family protein [Alphaproteobacteria bacterium]